jgi:hypothetical protein
MTTAQKKRASGEARFAEIQGGSDPDGKFD